MQTESPRAMRIRRNAIRFNQPVLFELADVAHLIRDDGPVIVRFSREPL